MNIFYQAQARKQQAELVHVNKSTAAYYFHRLGEIIGLETQNQDVFSGKFEVDERYFGGPRKGKSGRRATAKVPVFGILKRGGQVYTRVISDANGKRLIAIIEDRVMPDSMVYSACWRGYDVQDVSEFRHDRINHSKMFADKHNQINGIENFWNQAKRYMRKFNAIPAKHVPLFLKECEWRFNNTNPKTQLKKLKQWVNKNMAN